MIALLLILIPLVTGILNFQLPKNTVIGKPLQLITNIVLLGVAIWGVTTTNTSLLQANYNWLPTLGAKFALQLDGLSKMLVLLTAVAGVCIAAATYHNDYKNIAQYLGFSQLALAGLMGVFLSNDCLLFYFFWELALLPAYFLCSIWGGEKRIAVTFKFFLYTFIGSLLLLVGILYVYFHTPDASFAAESMYKAVLTKQEKMGLFWLFFVAFAIKMPIFPFHTWQPDTYEQSPTGVTMLLSGVMV
ncbi:MAG: NADH-quinone oxidoreductase subunit M, partial [Bacteroidetes bacterium]